ncbi:MAG: 50S ribosomal protein L25 [Myxococcales bacterium]|jgi:large subunit ribosomal protein L25
MSNVMPTLQATPRTALGKADVRRLRRTGVVPAVAYGKGLPSTALSVAPKEVLAIIKSEHGRNSVIDFDMGGTKILVMIREFQIHPTQRSLEHVDFIEVKLDKPVDVEIPLVTTGKAAGVAQGGVLRQVFRTLPARCLPNRIPAKLEIEISHLNLGEHVSTKDLKLEEGVTVRLPQDQTLVAVVAPEKERVEAVEVVPGAPGAPGAPAAAGAAAAAPAKDAKAEPAKAAKAGKPSKDDKKKK